jgi:orotidine-5'-phosphate decarboxylase
MATKTGKKAASPAKEVAKPKADPKPAARTSNPRSAPVVKTTKGGQKYVSRVIDQMAKG